MTATTDLYIAKLVELLGPPPVIESPAHSNRTVIGERFGWNGVAWCAETQSVIAEAVFGWRILWTAGVAQARDFAQRGVNGLKWHDRDAEIKVCFLSCFDFGGRGNPADFHISCVVNPGTQDSFETIGGNEGDAVRRQWRNRKYILGFIELPFDQVGLGSTPDEGELMSVTELIQKMYNSIFGDPNTPGSGLEARVANTEHEATTAREESAAAHQLAKDSNDRVIHIEKMLGSLIEKYNKDNPGK